MTRCSWFLLLATLLVGLRAPVRAAAETDPTGRYGVFQYGIPIAELEVTTHYMFWMLDQELQPERTWAEVLRHRPVIEIDSYATGRDLAQWNRRALSCPHASGTQRTNKKIP